MRDSPDSTHLHSMEDEPLVRMYLSRLGLSGKAAEDLRPAISTLQLLIERQLSCIPFENLSLHNPTDEDFCPIVLSKEHLIDKLLRRKRGGCCLELTGLLYYVLLALHFRDVKLVPCWVAAGKERGHRGRKRKFRTTPTHVMIRVAVQDTDDHSDADGSTSFYLVDVGLGEPPMGPLRYGTESFLAIQVTSEGMQSRIVRENRMWVDGHGVTRHCAILEWKKDGVWEPRLQWDLAQAPYLPQDEPSSNVLRTNDSSLFVPQRVVQPLDFAYVIPILLDPASTFMTKVIVCKLTKDTKTTLAGSELKFTKRRTPRFGTKEVHRRELQTEEEVRRVLEHTFGIPRSETEGLDLENPAWTSQNKLWDHL